MTHQTDDANRALEAAKRALGDNLADAIVCATGSGISLATIRSTFEQIMAHHESQVNQAEVEQAMADLGPGNAEQAASEPELMVEVTIEVEDVASDRFPVEGQEQARDAVRTILGTGRRVESLAGGTGWLVEFTQQEWDVLQSQGYIELASGPYVIRAEMP